MTRAIIQQVDADRLRRDLFHLSSDPIRFRKANYTAPGRDQCSLADADDFICEQLAQAGLEVTTTQHQVQAFRCNPNKPLHHWYDTPEPEDPWYEVSNLEVEIPGTEVPDEIIQLISHKDSMSWINSPGAHDNAVGTVANMEIARVIAATPLQRTVRILFCNEEHTPWWSKATAETAFARGDHLIAVLNQDSLAGKSDEDHASGRMPHVVCYSTDEGKSLAELIEQTAQTLDLGLDVELVFKEFINDDDGMFINAGYRTAVCNIGSFPYADSQYHLEGDCPERVDIKHLHRSTQLVLASVVTIAENGVS